MNKHSDNKIIVDATDSSLNLNLKELFYYKDLFFVLAYKDLRVRYAQTFLGLIWAVIQPLTTLLIMTVVFGRFVKVDTGGVHRGLGGGWSGASSSRWGWFEKWWSFENACVAQLLCDKWGEVISKYPCKVFPKY